MPTTPGCRCRTGAREYTLQPSTRDCGSTGPPYLLSPIHSPTQPQTLPQPRPERSRRVSAKQHVPLPSYMSNLNKIVAALRSRGVKNIVLITPPPVYEPLRRTSDRWNNVTK